MRVGSVLCWSSFEHARVAELVDALGSGSSVLTDVEVRVFSRAVLSIYPERDYGLSQLRKAFYLLICSAGYSKNTTISGNDDPRSGIGPVILSLPPDRSVQGNTMDSGVGPVEGARLGPFSQMSRPRESRDYPTSRPYSSWVPIQPQTYSAPSFTAKALTASGTLTDQNFTNRLEVQRWMVVIRL